MIKILHKNFFKKNKLVFTKNKQNLIKFQNFKINEVEDYVYITGIRKKEFQKSFDVQKDKNFINLIKESKADKLKIEEFIKLFESNSFEYKAANLNAICLTLLYHKFYYEPLINFIKYKFIYMKDILILLSFTSTCQYFKHFNINIPEENIKIFERTVYEKGILLNLREAVEIVKHYNILEKYISQKCILYLEKIIMHNIENANLPSQSFFQMYFIDLAKFYYNKASINFIEKLLSILAKLVNNDQFLLSDLANFLYYIIYFTNTNNFKYDSKFVEKKVLLVKFCQNINEKLFNSIQKEINAEVTNILGLLHASFYMSDVMHQNGKLLGDLIMDTLLLNQSNLNLSSVCEILNIFVRIKFVHQQKFKSSIDSLFLAQIKNVDNIKNLKVFANYAFKYKQDKAIYKYLELCLLKILFNKHMIYLKQDKLELFIIFRVFLENKYTYNYSNMLLASIYEFMEINNLKFDKSEESIVKEADQSNYLEEDEIIERDILKDDIMNTISVPEIENKI